MTSRKLIDDGFLDVRSAVGALHKDTFQPAFICVYDNFLAIPSSNHDVAYVFNKTDMEGEIVLETVDVSEIKRLKVSV